MEPDRETKMKFVTIIQPLTLFPTFPDAQATYSRGIPMVIFARAPVVVASLRLELAPDRAVGAPQAKTVQKKQ